MRSYVRRGQEGEEAEARGGRTSGSRGVSVCPVCCAVHVASLLSLSLSLVLSEFLIGMVGGFCSLYQGYRGVAGDLVRSSRIYLLAQSCLTLLMILFAIITSGNVHGFVGITSHVEDRPQSVARRGEERCGGREHRGDGLSDLERIALIPLFVCVRFVCSCVRPGYLLMCIFEGTLWLVCAVASVWVMHGVYRVSAGCRQSGGGCAHWALRAARDERP